MIAAGALGSSDMEVIDPNQFVSLSNNSLSVYDIGKDRASINESLTSRTQRVFDKLRSSGVSDEETTARRIMELYAEEPRPTLIMLYAIGGQELLSQLGKDYGPGTVDLFSGVVRGTITNALVSGANLDMGRFASNAIATLIYTQAAKADVHGQSGIVSGPGAGLIEESPHGIVVRKSGSQYYVVDDGVSMAFGSAEDARREMQRREEVKRNEYRIWDIWTSTDSRGNTRTEQFYGTKDQAEAERFNRGIEEGNKQVMRDAENVVREAEKAGGDLLQGIQKGLDDLFKQK